MTQSEPTRGSSDPRTRAGFDLVAKRLASMSDTALANLALSAPPGKMDVYAGTSAPDGWLLCYGQSLLRSAYPDLFDAIGTTYGAADGTHFSVPDARGRVLVGLDNMGGSDAGRLSAANTLGGSGGAETHTLLLTESPAHSHLNDAGGQFVGNVGGSGGSANVTTGGGGYALGATDSQGGGGAHNNMQPYLLVNWIIKT